MLFYYITKLLIKLSLLLSSLILYPNFKYVIIEIRIVKLKKNSV